MKFADLSEYSDNTTVFKIFKKKLQSNIFVNIKE